jgi:UV DNA damage endonuclease
MYSVKDLYEGIYKKIGVPITFDFHHHRFCNGGLSEEQALRLASLTWDVKQLTHYSSCKKTHEDKTVKAQAHADYIYEKINNYGLSFDIEIESKAKERAVLKYISTQHLLLDSYLPI